MSKIYRPVIPIWIEEQNMRLIDADELIESVCHTADLGGWIGDTLRTIKRLAVRYINSTPTVDAVEVVRCRDCRWSEPNEFDDYDCRCHIPIFRVNADGFCSCGERKESE